MEWPAHLLLVRGGGVSIWYQSISWYKLRLEEKLSKHKLVIEPSLRKPVLVNIVVFVYTSLHYWQPCIFKFKVHTYEVIQSIKQLIFFFILITTLCQEEDVEVVLGEIF